MYEEPIQTSQQAMFLQFMPFKRSQLIKCKENQTKQHIQNEKQKIGYGLFKFVQGKHIKINKLVDKLLYSYPCWFMKQVELQRPQFQSILKHMIEAYPKEIYIFQKSYSATKIRLLSIIEPIKFPCLKVMHIVFISEVNLQSIQFLDAECLQQIHIETRGRFCNVRAFLKTNFRNLVMLNLNNMSESETNTHLSKNYDRLFDLSGFYRTRFMGNQHNKKKYNEKIVKGSDYRNKSQLNNIDRIPKIYQHTGTVNICRNDLTNINLYCKLQIQRLTNFHLPYFSVNHDNNQQLNRINNHVLHNTPPTINLNNFHDQRVFHQLNLNQVDFGSQIQFCQNKIYKALNNKFGNMTVSMLIVDYMFGLRE